MRKKCDMKVNRKIFQFPLKADQKHKIKFHECMDEMEIDFQKKWWKKKLRENYFKPNNKVEQ